MIGLPPTDTILAGSPDTANDSDLRQHLDVTNLACIILQAGSHSPVSPMTQPLTATSVLAPQSSMACTTSAAQLQHLPPRSLLNSSQSRAASGDSSLQVHLLPSAITPLDERHTPTPGGAELQNDPEVIAAVATGAFAAQADLATTVVQEHSAAQADLTTTVVKEHPAAQAEPATTAVKEIIAGQADPDTTVVKENPAAQAGLGTAAPTWPQQRMASLNECSSCECATYEEKSSAGSKGDELQVDEASSQQRHAAAKDGHLQQRIGTADNAALDAAGVQPLMQEEQEGIKHVAGMPVAASLLRQHSYIQQAANMAPIAMAAISPTAEERRDAVVGSQLCPDSLHKEHDGEAPLHGHLELQPSHAKGVSEGCDTADGQISQLPESASQPSMPAHQPHVHAHQPSVSANQPNIHPRQVSMSACEAALASQQTVPAHQLSSSACQLKMLTNQQDAAAHLQLSADQAQAFDIAAENQQGQQQQRQNMGLLKVSNASVDHAKGQSCLALCGGEQQTCPCLVCIAANQSTQSEQSKSQCPLVG